MSESGKFLLVESGIWKTAQGIRIPPTIGIRNPRVTKIRIPISGIPSTVGSSKSSLEFLSMRRYKDRGFWKGSVLADGLQNQSCHRLSQFFFIKCLTISFGVSVTISNFGSIIFVKKHDKKMWMFLATHLEHTFRTWLVPSFLRR